MKKSKINYEASMKQVDLMMPKEYQESTKIALTNCKDISKYDQTLK